MLVDKTVGHSAVRKVGLTAAAKVVLLVEKLAASKVGQRVGVKDVLLVARMVGWWVDLRDESKALM